MDWSFTWAIPSPPVHVHTRQPGRNLWPGLRHRRRAQRQPYHLVLHIQTGEDTWANPQLRVRGCSGRINRYCHGPLPTVRARRERSGHRRRDGISTIEETAATIINTIPTEYGLTQTGAPSRVIPTFDLMEQPAGLARRTAARLRVPHEHEHGWPAVVHAVHLARKRPCSRDREHLEGGRLPALG